MPNWFTGIFKRSKVQDTTPAADQKVLAKMNFHPNKNLGMGMVHTYGVHKDGSEYTFRRTSDEQIDRVTVQFMKREGDPLGLGALLLIYDEHEQNIASLNIQPHEVKNFKLSHDTIAFSRQGDTSVCKLPLKLNDEVEKRYYMDQREVLERKNMKLKKQTTKKYTEEKTNECETEAIRLQRKMQEKRRTRRLTMPKKRVRALTIAEKLYNAQDKQSEENQAEGNQSTEGKDKVVVKSDVQALPKTKKHKKPRSVLDDFRQSLETLKRALVAEDDKEVDEDYFWESVTELATALKKTHPNDFEKFNNVMQEEIGYQMLPVARFDDDGQVIESENYFINTSTVEDRDYGEDAINTIKSMIDEGQHFLHGEEILVLVNDGEQSGGECKVNAYSEASFFLVPQVKSATR